MGMGSTSIAVAVWIVTALSAAGLAAFFIWMYASGRRAAERALWNEPVPFSAENYHPMEMLLCEDEAQALRSMPGYQPEIGARFRRERRRIFRMYLRELRGDFQRIHSEARALAAHSGAEGAALIGMLLRQQMAFWTANAALEARLALHWAGVGPVDVRALVGSVERIRVDLVRFQAAQSL